MKSVMLASVLCGGCVLGGQGPSIEEPAPAESPAGEAIEDGIGRLTPAPQTLPATDAPRSEAATSFDVYGVGHYEANVLESTCVGRYVGESFGGAASLSIDHGAVVLSLDAYPTVEGALAGMDAAVAGEQTIWMHGDVLCSVEGLVRPTPRGAEGTLSESLTFGPNLTCATKVSYRVVLK